MSRKLLILHVIERVGSGGAFHGTLNAAKYSVRRGEYAHTVLSLLPPLPEFVEKAEALGVCVVHPASHAERDLHVARADIVQVEWWNNPSINAFIDSSLPPCRLVAWLRVNGSSPAHGVPPRLLDWADHIMMCCPMIGDSEPISRMPPEQRRAKVSELFAGDELDHLPRPSPRDKPAGEPFIVGYVGTVDFIKMHPGYLRMSAAARIPGIRFEVCGDGPLDEMEARAEALGAADRFVFRGLVRDVGAALATFDVFGYPLCHETYAASEKSLQEAMFAGVPPVVFPHGGVKDLVADGKTGCVVRTEAEYTRALEHLYHHPDERRRLGQRAHEWASRHFGAHSQTDKLLQIYRTVLKAPKRPRAGVPRSSALTPAGAEALLASLRPDEAVPFRISASGSPPSRMLAADATIAASSAPLLSVIRKYQDFYASDPLLTLWLGVACLGAGRCEEALEYLCLAARQGLDDWRADWYAALAAEVLGRSAERADHLRALEARGVDVRKLGAPTFIGKEPGVREEGRFA